MYHNRSIIKNHNYKPHVHAGLTGTRLHNSTIDNAVQKPITIHIYNTMP